MCQLLNFNFLKFKFMSLENHNGEGCKVKLMERLKELHFLKLGLCLFLRVLSCRAGLPQTYSPLASAMLQSQAVAISLGSNLRGCLFWLLACLFYVLGGGDKDSSENVGIISLSSCPFKIPVLGLGEVAEHLREHCTLSEDHSWVPSTPLRRLQLTVVGDLAPPSGFLSYLH